MASEWLWTEGPDKFMIAGRQVAGGQVQTYCDEQLIPAKNVKPMHQTSIQGVEDMITLGDLHEGSLLHNIHLRYLKDDIYTYTGNILVAVNPYKSLPTYSGEYIKKYQGKSLGDLPPHIYAIANEAYYSLLKTKRNQCCVISGESGAGKTESTKLILNFLTCVSTKKSLVQDQILDASPILEAFGNAKTVRNDNSSRFGKFLEVQFAPDGSIAGAVTLQYLLEKSRIVFQAPEERNYHIFYNLLAGATDQEKSDMKLGKPQDFRYLNQSGCYTLKNVDDATSMKEVREAMHTLDFEKHTKTIFRAIAAVLHLGNIVFNEQGEGVAINDLKVVNTVADLLSVDSEKLQKGLITRTTVTRGETFVTPLTKIQANDSRDAMAKAIYGRLFSWIVTFINEQTKKPGDLHFVGVLDIFGFEDFQTNSFEQFCINYANERLQYYFNQHIFKLEQEEYSKEGINWSKIEFIDNQGTIDLISKKPVGLLYLLDEESNFPKSSDQTLLSKFHENHAQNPSYIKPKTQQPFFGVRHYAGDVMYFIEGFLEKNRDTLRQDLTDLIRDSSQNLICQWFEPSADVNEAPGNTSSRASSVASLEAGTSNTISSKRVSASTSNLSGSSATLSESPSGTMKSSASKKNAKALTTGYQFHSSLSDLIATLTSCNPYFVRCIKPNTSKAVRLIDRNMVMAQLRYSGMLETIRVRRAGFSYRSAFEDFLGRYALLIPGIRKQCGDNLSEACKRVLSLVQVPKDQWQMGKTKVFAKNTVEAALESLRAQKLVVFVLKLQGFAKMVIAKRYLKRAKAAVLVMQRLARGFLARRYRKRCMRHITRVQARFRGYMIRKRYASEIAQFRMKWQQKKTIEQNVAEEDDEEERALREREEELLRYLETTNDERMKNATMRQDRRPNASKKVNLYPQDFQKLLSSCNFDLIGPLSTSDNRFIPFIPDMTNLIDPEQDDMGSMDSIKDAANEITDGAWPKFSRIFFRDGSKPAFARSIKDSLLKLPKDAAETATQIFRVLIKIVSDESQLETVYCAFFYISEKIEAMQDFCGFLPGGLTAYDEIICQATKLTYQNPDNVSRTKAWKVLGVLLSMYPPSPKLAKCLHSYISSDAPEEYSMKLLSNMERSVARGPRLQNLTSVELISHLKELPMVLECEWVDSDESVQFELDSATTPVDILQSVAQTKGLQNLEGYLVTVEINGLEFRVAPHEHIFDAIAKIEKTLHTYSGQSEGLGRS